MNFLSEGCCDYGIFVLVVDEDFVVVDVGLCFGCF